jgi:hypothetical protein
MSLGGALRNIDYSNSIPSATGKGGASNPPSLFDESLPQFTGDDPYSQIMARMPAFRNPYENFVPGTALGGFDPNLYTRAIQDINGNLYGGDGSGGMAGGDSSPSTGIGDGGISGGGGGGAATDGGEGFSAANSSDFGDTSSVSDSVGDGGVSGGGGGGAADSGGVGVGDGGVSGGGGGGAADSGGVGDGGVGAGDGGAGAGDGGGGGGGGGGGAGCFFTTAAVAHMGQKDNGKVLNTLRKFRDTYMRKNKEKSKDVEWYYENAPRIVAALDERPDAAKVYKKMYREYIKPAYDAIQKGDQDRAYQIYKEIIDFSKKESGIDRDELTPRYGSKAMLSSGLIGDYIIKEPAVKKYGVGLLDMINEGKVPAKKIKSLLD